VRGTESRHWLVALIVSDLVVLSALALPVDTAANGSLAGHYSTLVTAEFSPSGRVGQKRCRSGDAWASRKRRGGGGGLVVVLIERELVTHGANENLYTPLGL
jgi:hypothetical protein